MFSVDYRQLFVILLPSFLFGLAFNSPNLCVDTRQHYTDCYHGDHCYPGTILNDIHITKEDLKMIFVVKAIGGFISSGFLSSNYLHAIGRKTLLRFHMWCYLLGIILGCIPSLPLLYISQSILGFAAGITRCVVPILLYEIAPKHSRGKSVTWHQLVASSTPLFLAPLKFLFIPFVPHGWIVLQAIGLIPLFLFYLLHDKYLPESPLWHISTNRGADALEALSFVRRDASQEVLGDELRDLINDEIDDEVVQIADDPVRDPNRLIATLHQISSSTILKSPWGSLFLPQNREKLFAGLGLTLFQNLSGISTVIFFSKQKNAPVFLTPILVLISILGVRYYIDHMTRKPLLLKGMNLMTVSLLLFSVCFAFEHQNATLRVLGSFALYVYVIGFTIGLTSVYDVVVCGLSKTNLRLKFFSLCSVLAYAEGIMTILTNPVAYQSENETWSPEGVAKRCNIYAGICFTGTLFIIFFIPETFPVSKL